MLNTIERLGIITSMSSNNLDLRLLKAHTAGSIMNLCSCLEQRHVPRERYAGYTDVQEELINDDRFFVLLQKFASSGIAMNEINKFLGILHANGESSLDYPANRLLSSMALTTNYSYIFLDYLKYFSNLQTDKGQKETIISNLKCYTGTLTISVDALPDAERSLFTENCLTCPKLIPSNADKAFNMLAYRPGLLDLIRFFYNNDLVYNLDEEHYAHLCTDTASIHDMLKLLLSMIGHNSMLLLLTRWLQFGCTLHDLVVMRSALEGLDSEKVEEAFCTRSSYIDLIYGGKIGNIPLGEITREKEDILIYAITHKKLGFLKLVEDNFEAFAGLQSGSVLFSRDFYKRHVNINALNANNLHSCTYMAAFAMSFELLEEGRVYTFDEMRALHGQADQYYVLYAKLTPPKVDKRLIAFKELTKSDLLSSVAGSTELGSLATRLSEKPLSIWRDREYGHISGINMRDIVSLLIHMDEVGKLVPFMETRNDMLLALRNRSYIKDYSTMDELKAGLVQNDSAWTSLARKMGFTSEFVDANWNRIIEFLSENGADIAFTYYNGLSGDMQRESLRRIVKSVLIGEFRTLKYHADDLSMELDYPVSGEQKSLWMENTALCSGKLEIREHDDFFGTMRLGVMPQRTCLSYNDGQYRECLLSNFDSNKKVLYAEKDGKIVGRALIRLTKGRFRHDEKDSGTATSLTFINPDEPDAVCSDVTVQADRERLVLFLEKSYSSGIDNLVLRQVQDLFIRLVERKASRMGAMPVLSSQYGDSLPGYTSMKFHVYISKSKAGTQYLDSLNGTAKVSDEGGYRSNSFYLRNCDL